MRRLCSGLAVVSLLSLSALEGCAPRALSDPFASPANRSMVLWVVNRGYDDVHVYLVRGSVPIPVGPVASMERRSFRLDPSVAPGWGDLRLMARPLGGGASFTSEPVLAHDGALLEWTLAHDLKYSTVRIQ